MLAYLIDENVDPVYPQQLRRKLPNLVVYVIGEPSTPLKGTKDPAILMWCEEYSFVLVTNNRASMPAHLRDHINQGHHCPGIFTLNPVLSIGQNIEELTVLAEVALDGEFNDQIVYLPVISAE